MNRTRTLRTVARGLLVISPFVAIALLSLRTGSSPFALDAWNTTWNDEQGYYSTVRQMRLFGEPVGMTGYNEVEAARASYGPYSPFVYIPYYIGSLVTGLGTHNFMYVTNVALTVLAVAVIAAVARPDARTALLLAGFFALQFIIARYGISGMTEASYVLFAAVFGSCALKAAGLGGASAGGKTVGKHARAPRTAAPSAHATAACLCVMTLASCFWGMMRPYLLAFMLVPWALLLFGKLGLSRAAKVILALGSVALTAATLAGYLYFSKYYATPYFYAPTIANSFADRIAAAIGGFFAQNVDSVVYSAKSLAALGWEGIMAFTFAAFWIALVVLAVRAGRRGERAACVLLASTALAGLAIYEANVLLYTYRQLHRTLIATDVVLVMAVLFAAAPKRGALRPSARLVMQAAVALLCIGALAVHPDEFDLPQQGGASGELQALSLQAEGFIPHASDPWDNTIAHPPESSNMGVYFSMPAYTALNCCQKGYLADAIKAGTLKSKYLCLPQDADMNAIARDAYEVVYTGQGHVLYKTR